MGALHPVPGAWAIEITDAAGRRIVLDKLPERIVVTGNAPFIPLHMLYMFDETRERLKGFEVKVRKPDEFLMLLDPELGSKQTLYSNPGPESVAALKPDLVISKAMVEGNPARSLKSLGIPVLYLGAENPDMFLADIKNLGKVFGNPERADTIVQYYRDKLSLIHEIVGTAALGGKPRVLVLEYSSRGKHLSLSVPARAWIQTQQAIISGGSPVWLDSLNLQDGWQVTGFEQIAAWNPDKIFLTVWYRLQGPEVINRLYQDSKWRQLKAVQQNTLILFPSEIFGWDAATPRWILGALWMTKMTYPEAPGSHALDIKQTARQFFKILYRMDEAEVDRHILSRMD
jgi:iron complex transport system substrate-binding protein